MQHTLVSPPRTIMEVFKMLPQGTLAEVIENTLYMSPTPTSNHQRISRKISTQLDGYVTQHDLGEVFYAPLDVYLDETSNAVQPDIFFVANANATIIKDKHIQGTPDLIVEILSPGNSRHDMVVKKALYEKFGVKEYWIVDPETKQATGHTRINNSYTLLHEDTARIASSLLQHTFSF